MSDELNTCQRLGFGSARPRSCLSCKVSSSDYSYSKLASRLSHGPDRKSTRLNSSHDQISYAVFCLKKKKKNDNHTLLERNTTNLNTERDESTNTTPGIRKSQGKYDTKPNATLQDQRHTPTHDTPM